MAGKAPAELTAILRAAREGDARAQDDLMALVHHELHGVARRLMDGQPAGHTLQSTAVVNEAFLRLFRGGASSTGWQDRAHFFRVASLCMRRILVDHARRRKVRKPPGERVDLDAQVNGASNHAISVIELDEALSRLAERAPFAAQVVEQRFFGGWSVEETARILGASTRKVERSWAAARAWLRRELDHG